ncbi:MAG: hypothetical protein JRI26_13585 [Deltaproteobacteria bacterium]|nr:hypothetical protein [Deltaproteobacteria bacterium]
MRLSVRLKTRVIISDTTMGLERNISLKVFAMLMMLAFLVDQIQQLSVPYFDLYGKTQKQKIVIGRHKVLF